jgi:5-formyltetrahydrofolate cyclo-ligase
VGEQLEFIEIPSLGHLAPSAWNRQIHEPAFAQAHLVTPAEIKLMIVPGLAFTRDGHRLGRGGGFYDRYLALLPSTAVKIGVCFSVQIVPSLPAEPHDQHMNAIITEQGPLDALG